MNDDSEFRSRKEADFQLAEFNENLIAKSLKPVTIIINDSHSLDGLGAPRTFGKAEEMVFLGRSSGGEERDYAGRMGEEIDHAVSELINAAYELAVDTITLHQSKLVRLAEYLIEYETVSGEAMNRLFNTDGESGGQTATPPVVPETPPAYAASPETSTPAGNPQPAASMPSTATADGDD
ncbi:MAG: hypothetical protein OSB07_06765 [Dehalococcoidia bacterium]|nr:hypothetical protein [Dehalococcoidia bacterium]